MTKSIFLKLLSVKSVGLYLFTLGLGLMANHPASAQEKLKFTLPLDCIPGQTCFVQNYVDMRNGDGYADYSCGPLSYNNHKGTDFRITSVAQMIKGVNVFAAADGVVESIRDTMPDVSYRLFGKNAVLNRGHGNRVVIKHDKVFRTVYAHLKLGSIRVRAGDIIRKGQKIAQVGMSGFTEFPHLHFEIRREKTLLDPFTGIEQETVCNAKNRRNTLWDARTDKSLTYIPTMLLRTAFSDVELNIAAMEHNLFERAQIRRTAKQLLFNVYLSGILKGDKIRIMMADPDGNVLSDSTKVADQDRAVYLSHIKLKRVSKKPWQKGVYKAKLIMTRLKKGLNTPLFDIEKTLTLN